MTMLLAFVLASTLDAATVKMSLDVQQPSRGSNITVTLLSLRDRTETVREEPWSSLDKLQQLEVAPGSYELLVTAPHHRPVRRHVVAAPGETVSLGVLALRALPSIRGVVTANGAPLANAVVRADDAHTTTDARGTFALEIGERRPALVIVDAPRLGTRVIDVPVTNGDVDLPPIELGPPSSVDVTVKRPKNTPVDVLIGFERRGSLHWITQRPLGAKESKATFAALSAGTYVLLVRGREPLQQYATRLPIGTNERRRTNVVIEPHALDLRVVLDHEPLANASLILLQPEQDWMARFSADANGRWRGDVWQRGPFVARVKSPALQALSTVETRIDGPELTLVLPALTVRGRIVDDSGAPVANANVSLRSEWADSSATAPLHTDGDGRFSFRGVPPGKQRLIVRADDHLLHEPLEFALEKEDRAIDVRLDRGVRKTIVVRDTHGAPVTNARVFCGEPERVWSTSATNAEGHATIALPRGGCALYIVPDGMSFALARATPRDLADPAPLPVYLGGATGRLEVSTKTEAGEPVSGVRLLVRYNGDVVPAEVVRALERFQGLAFRTDDGGVATLPALPLGTYELWPYRSEREAENIIAAGSLFEAPIALTLKTGQNHVAVKLRLR